MGSSAIVARACWGSVSSILPNVTVPRRGRSRGRDTHRSLLSRRPRILTSCLRVPSSSSADSFRVPSSSFSSLAGRSLDLVQRRSRPRNPVDTSSGWTSPERFVSDAMDPTNTAESVALLAPRRTCPQLGHVPSVFGKTRTLHFSHLSICDMASSGAGSPPEPNWSSKHWDGPGSEHELRR